MGVVGSLPSPSPSTQNNIMHTESKQIVSSADECSLSNPSIYDVETPADKTIPKKPSRRKKSSPPITVVYGPINIKVRQSAAPTLATGRCSKFVELEGEAAVKREIRRKRNREAAKKLKEKRSIIEDNLKKQISEYEAQEKSLLLTIQNLRTYKEYLEYQYQQITSVQESISRSAFKKVGHKRMHLDRSVPIHPNTMRSKEESRRSSPQWQLLFSI
ncbi:unnamed protein product [Adineta ricciae]|uniref:BZIP domain-containing protein n=1 Tax=Adineta ricciae TaxID=249248 RepID=A0A814K7Z9_ADIRI|nr:unnamed protein product [Adineta ricciae]